MTVDEARKKILQDYMGKPVHVIVDRPIGYVHGEITYPINYGYLPGVLAGDGEEQDAYILGVDEPVSEFDGQVVGAIRRKNDCEDKLVVAPMGTVFHQGQIAQAVQFQEQYFVSTIDSLFRKSCGVIPFRQNGDKREFLILLQTNSCWSFPKGHMEAGETEEETALRELFEETGLTAKLDTSRCASIAYPISDFARKEVVFYLGEVAGEPKVQESEIEIYKWVTFRELENYLFPNAFEACRKLLK
jgi:8-oxo-dGTP pyrophosphatase MutT (NUDIX family)